MPNNEDIIASIASNKRDEENDTDDHSDELPNITYQAASQVLSIIQAYLLQLREPPYSLLEKLDTEILKHHNKSLVQSTITDYFHRQ